MNANEAKVFKAHAAPQGLFENLINERWCGQTLNNDGLLSVWFNDEDCLAYVRDAYFLNR